MRAYPFKPTSTTKLQPGDFWALPLADGKVGCGRVIAIKTDARPGQRSMLLAGVMDWVGTAPPSAESIAGCATHAQGEIHLRCIRETGGEILGSRPLEADGIEVGEFLSEQPGRNCMLMRGYDVIRPASAEEQLRLAVFPTWGYLVMVGLAEAMAKDLARPA